ncbi:phosphoadenosine phosphosulfate reductase family protein [Marinobacterium aestuariivivens]|uniref:Phosphoadenosine phosphosulfate reductase family protein n=1 Tax=Marinobacterium aestuariivivens TaxID=1698799 RepID=A0ABW2A9A4_9GAMM
MNMIAVSAAPRTNAGRFSEIIEKAEKAIAQIDALFEQNRTIQVACSFGKDSSAVLVLVLEALKRRVERGSHSQTMFVSHANTGIENPALDIYAEAMMTELDMFAARYQLPVKAVKVQPSLSGSFQYATIGRGKLPVFVGAQRSCSVDWKIKPQRKAVKQLLKTFQNPGDLVTLVGTRFSESRSRGNAMRERGDSATKVTVNDDGSLSQAIIADWEVDDVWMLLMACDKNRGGVIQTFVENFNWCLDLYRDANDGMCAVITGDGGNKASCGARFGCVFCTVTGEKDRSLTAMIETDPKKYRYLNGLNVLRDFLIKTRWDMSRRDWLGRRASPAGYIAVTATAYSATMRRDLLRYLLTLDIEEEERALEHDGRFTTGEIADTEDNRTLCGPMFQFITPKMLVAIDFAWSMSFGTDHAFSALAEWYEIRVLGKRYPIPDIEPFERGEIPSILWFKFEEYDSPVHEDGLMDSYLEATNNNRYPDRPPMRTIRDKYTNSKRRIVYYEEADELTVDSMDALLFVDEFDKELYDLAKSLTPSDSAKFYLNRGLVKLAKGRAQDYDEILRRAQYWTRLQSNLGETDLRTFVRHHSISDDEHRAILAELEPSNEEGSVTLDLFS